MNSTTWQLTKREMRATFASSGFWIGVACVVAVLTISGPFGTDRDLLVAQRFAYWGGIALSTYLVGIIFMVPIAIYTDAKNWPWQVSALLEGSVAGLPIGCLVYVVNTYIVGIDEPSVRSLFRLIFICVIIALATAFLRYAIRGPGAARKVTPVDTRLEAFMRRLPAEKRGTLISLRAQDHYIEVTTQKGQELILMRLGDAVEELRDIDGKRVHRSWWIAKSGVQGIERNGERWDVRLSNGQRVPISRANQNDVRRWLDS